MYYDDGRAEFSKYEREFEEKPETKCTEMPNFDKWVDWADTEKKRDEFYDLMIKENTEGKIAAMDY